MLARAANLYKMAKKWNEAGETFCKIATHQLSEGNKHDAATNYVDGANCYKKNDPKEAAACLQRAIDIYTDMGRFTIAAKHHQTIAELFEAQTGDLDQAMQHYEQAAEYFRGEESHSSANKCMLKVAEYSATLEKYEKAIKIYETVAAASLENQLLKYAAKDQFFRASLCHLYLCILPITSIILQMTEALNWLRKKTKDMGTWVFQVLGVQQPPLLPAAQQEHQLPAAQQQELQLQLQQLQLQLDEDVPDIICLP